MLRRIAIALCALTVCGAAIAARTSSVLLPTGWRLSPAEGPVVTTGAMPQGVALSPDGATLAVIESGVPAPALQLFDLPSLHSRTVPLAGAFGRPVWIDRTHVALPGANTGGVIVVDTTTGAARTLDAVKGSWPAAIAPLADGTFALADDASGTVRLEHSAITVGQHPCDIVRTNDGKTLYVSVREPSSLAVIDVRSAAIVARIPTGLHPCALAFGSDGGTLYVAESDDDSIGVVDTRTNTLVRHIFVGLREGRASGYGASPNALLVNGNDLYVSLGAQNAVAVIRSNRLTSRIPAGWYPTGLAMGNDGTLYVSNGKGESAPANPQFNPLRRDSPGYVGDITLGSLRAIPAAVYRQEAAQTQAALEDARPQWTQEPSNATIVRAHGPIRHVIYIIKENRSYDQVLGDIRNADGDPSLVMFGRAITPNQHVLAERFGILDNAYTDAQVSANGHNFTDAAFANDYVERFWPPNYGGRRDLYDFQDGNAPDAPHGGYLWDAAKRAGIAYRDYGEDIVFGNRLKLPLNTFAGLSGHFDPRYVGWDLHTSDAARFAEWHREFQAFVAARSLPQLEIVYLPNDHTAGTSPGMPTPQAYVAMNDWMTGRIVEAVSHSPYWRSTAIFALEDDAQNGPDHVSDQRSTFYLASPYAKGGVRHAHYSTVGIVHTIELLLGLPPLSVYDAVARPLYDAFALTPVNAQPYDAIRPSVDMNAVNTKAAYKSAVSARLDFSHADAVDPRVLNDILEHSVRR